MTTETARELRFPRCFSTLESQLCKQKMKIYSYGNHIMKTNCAEMLAISQNIFRKKNLCKLNYVNISADMTAHINTVMTTRL